MFRFLLVAVLITLGVARSDRPPNIIMLMSEYEYQTTKMLFLTAILSLVAISSDQGWGEVGYQCQHPQNKTLCPMTPHTDEFSKSEHVLKFTRFYAGSGVCSPTRVWLMRVWRA